MSIVFGREKRSQSCSENTKLPGPGTYDITSTFFVKKKWFIKIQIIIIYFNNKNWSTMTLKFIIPFNRKSETFNNIL